MADEELEQMSEDERAMMEQWEGMADEGDAEATLTKSLILVMMAKKMLGYSIKMKSTVF